MRFFSFIEIAIKWVVLIGFGLLLLGLGLLIRLGALILRLVIWLFKVVVEKIRNRRTRRITEDGWYRP